MKCLLIMFICLCTVVLGNAQYNLVRNYSFEENVVCPTPINNVLPSPWLQPSTWQLGVFCHVCSTDTLSSIPFNYYFKSYQYPRTGNGYSLIGIISGPQNWRSYLQQELRDSLKKNKCYYVEFWVSLVDYMKYACNNVSALLSKNVVSATNLNIISSIPQITNFSNPIIADTFNWVKVSAVFSAQGGEKFITIGNFYDFANTNYSIRNLSSSHSSEYYIDDISVIPLDSITLKADAGQDKNITLGDSTFIGSYTNGLTGVRWFNNLGQEITNKAGIPGFFVKPLVSTFYVIEQNVCGQFSRDTVNINVSLMPLKFTTYNIILRNEKSIENIWTTANETNVSHLNIQRSENGIDFKTIDSLKANNSSINEYSFTDLLTTNYSLPTTIYYRILALDFDGKKTYSTIKQINLNNLYAKPLNIFPNPANDFINITSKEKIKALKLFNSYGQIVKQQFFNLPTNSLLWRLEEAKGIYIIQITTIHNQIITQKIVLK